MRTYTESRGLGLLAILPPPLGVAAFGSLIDYGSRVAGLGAFLTIAFAGAGPVIAVRKLNRYGNDHSLYGIPL